MDSPLKTSSSIENIHVAKMLMDVRKIHQKEFVTHHGKGIPAVLIYFRKHLREIVDLVHLCSLI